MGVPERQVKILTEPRPGQLSDKYQKNCLFKYC